MWIVFGGVAIVSTFLNLYFYIKRKDYTLAMGIGLSFTALTLVAEYSIVSNSLIEEDWSSLLDVVPTMEMVLWILTIISILLNLTPLFLDWKNKR